MTVTLQSCRAKPALSRLFRQPIRFEATMTEILFHGIDSAAEPQNGITHRILRISCMNAIVLQTPLSVYTA